MKTKDQIKPFEVEECACSRCTSQDVDSRLRQLANLVIDRVLEDKAKGVLKFQVRSITVTVVARGFIVK